MKNATRVLAGFAIAPALVFGGMSTAHANDTERPASAVSVKVRDLGDGHYRIVARTQTAAQTARLQFSRGSGWTTLAEEAVGTSGRAVFVTELPELVVTSSDRWRVRYTAPATSSAFVLWK